MPGGKSTSPPPAIDAVSRQVVTFSHPGVTPTVKRVEGHVGGESTERLEMRGGGREAREGGAQSLHRPLLTNREYAPGGSEEGSSRSKR